MGAVVAWSVTSIPCVIYLLFAGSYFVRGRSRREQVEQLFEVETVRAFYLKAYRVKTLEGLAARILPRWTEHVLPLAICAAITFPVSVMAARAADLPLGLAQDLLDKIAVPPQVLAGFAGAYLWGLVACIERFRVVNWTPGFTHGLWIRILISGVLGGLLPFPADAAYLPLLAFSLGAFPVATLGKWVRRRAGKILGLEEDDEGAGPRWSTIQGVTPELLDRLREADVASPAALANADPFRLFLRTNITWRHILDLIDQAILVGYIGEKIELVRPMGIRGAIEMGLVAERLIKLDPENVRHKPVLTSAAATLAKLSKALGHDDTDVTRNLIQNLDEDAQVELIWNLWFEEEAKGVISDALADPPADAPDQRTDVTREFEPGLPSKSTGETVVKIG